MININIYLVSNLDLKGAEIMKNFKIVIVINILCAIVFLINTIARIYFGDIKGGIAFAVAAILFVISAILNYKNYIRTKE